MKYTNEQYRLMEHLRSGVIWNGLSEQEQDILRDLDSEEIAEPRAYIQDGLWVLSQKGQAILETLQDEMQSAEQIVAQSAQPQVDHEQYPSDKLKKRKTNWGKVSTAFISIVGLIASIVAIIEFLFGVIG